MPEFLIGMSQEFLGDAFRSYTFRKEMVTTISQHAYEFSGQGVIEETENACSVPCVAIRHSALFDMLTRFASKGSDIGQRLIRMSIWLSYHRPYSNSVE